MLCYIMSYCIILHRIISPYMAQSWAPPDGTIYSLYNMTCPSHVMMSSSLSWWQGPAAQQLWADGCRLSLCSRESKKRFRHQALGASSERWRNDGRMASGIFVALPSRLSFTHTHIYITIYHIYNIHVHVRTNVLYVYIACDLSLALSCK